MKSWKFVNGMEIRFRSDGRPTSKLMSANFIKPIERTDEMTTIYDIDELKEENLTLKSELKQVAQFLADCLHEDDGLSFPKRENCKYAKMLLEKYKND